MVLEEGVETGLPIALAKKNLSQSAVCSVQNKLNKCYLCTQYNNVLKASRIEPSPGSIRALTRLGSQTVKGSAFEAFIFRDPIATRSVTPVWRILIAGKKRSP